MNTVMAKWIWMLNTSPRATNKANAEAGTLMGPKYVWLRNPNPYLYSSQMYGDEYGNRTKRKLWTPSSVSLKNQP